jgi:restriction endonuclease S subunit
VTVPLRRMQNGSWSRPPVLTAARAAFLGALEKDHPSVPLEQMASFVNGTSYDSGLAGLGETPIIRISNITDPTASFVTTVENFDSKFAVSPGDLLVSWSASFKSILWPGPSGILNQHIFRVEERPGNSRSYIRHAIEGSFDEMQQQVVGIGMMHLRRADILGHSIPAPSNETQEVVGAYLDWIESGCKDPEPSLPIELHSVRELVRRIRQIAEKLAVVARLLNEAAADISQLVSVLLDELCDQSRPLGQLGDVLTGRPRNGWSPRGGSDPSGTAVLTLAAVTGYRYDSSAVKYTSLPVEENAHYWLESGDLLITRSNTLELVGHAAIYDGSPFPCIYPDLMMKIPLDLEKVSRRYVWMWLQTSVVREFIKGAAKGTSATMKKISQATVVEIPFPTGTGLGRQRELLAKFNEQDQRVDELLRLHASASEEADSLLLSVLQPAFGEDWEAS